MSLAIHGGRVKRTRLFAVALVLLAVPAASLTYAPATDAELVDGAAAIVLGEVVSVRETPRYRYLTVAVDGVLKGSAGATVTVEQVGGTEWIVPGAPQAVLGDRGVWFLDADGRADPAVGWMQQAGERYVSIDGEARDAGRFRAWVEDRAAGRRRPADYQPVGPVSVAQPYSLLSSRCGGTDRVVRWRTHPTWSANDMALSGTYGSVGWSDLVASAARWEAASAVSLPLSRTAERVTGVLRVSLNSAGLGLGYTDPPTVTFSAPTGGGRRAAGTAVLGQWRIVGQEDTELQLGTVSRVDVSDSGDYGLLDNPQVTFSAPVDKGSLSRLKWSRGSGYVEAPAVTVSDAPAGGTTARLEARILDGEVVEIVPTDRGAGYTSAPTVSIAAPPAGGTQAEILLVETVLRTAAAPVGGGPDFDRLPTPTHISDTGIGISPFGITLGRVWVFCGTSYDAGNLGPATEPSRAYVTIVRNFLDHYSPDDWRQTMTHELGHALGLDHTSDQAAIMWPVNISGRGYHLGDDDIAGIRALYGVESPDPPPDDDGGGGPPEAGFTVTAECADSLCRARTGAAVTFEDVSTGVVRLRRWDFGDGRQSRSGRLSYAWSSPGFYEVTLRVSDGTVESTASRTFLVEASEPAGTCVADGETVCLQDSRYSVSVEWFAADGSGGAGRVAHAGTNDSGLFWFFGGENWEVLIKVLDGCSLNGHVWVFGASTTNLGYLIHVTDTVTGTFKEYRNEPGRPAPAITDPTAFPGGCGR